MQSSAPDALADGSEACRTLVVCLIELIDFMCILEVCVWDKDRKEEEVSVFPWKLCEGGETLGIYNFMQTGEGKVS